MPCQPLLKAPVGVLLLTVAVSPQMFVATRAAPPKTAPPLVHGLRTAPIVKPGTRPEIDDDLAEGIQRWGLNE
jgi:hypothetical protein